jgi:hypothetical protein
MNEDFLRAVLLKVAFKPEPLKRAQAALIYVALRGLPFTADVLPKEITGDDTKLAGCATGSLATMGLIQSVGRVKSPAESRNGAWVNQWALCGDKRATAKIWLSRNGFDVNEVAEKNGELPL